MSHVNVTTKKLVKTERE